MRLRNYLRSFSAGELVAIILICAVVAYLTASPIAALLYGASLSHSPTSPDATLTLKNWTALFTNTRYIEPITNTFVMATVVTFSSVLFGMVLGWGLTRANVPYRKPLEFFIMLPMLLSPFVGAMAWVALAGPRAGLLNVLLELLGSKPIFNIYSPTGVMFVMFLFHVPYGYLFTAGASSVLDPSLEEASQMLGGSLWTTLRKVTLPLITPAVGSALVLVFVRSAEMFSIPAILGRPGGYVNIPYLIYRQINSSPPNWPMAAAMGSLLLGVAILGVWLQRRLTRQSSRFVTVTGKAYRPRIVDLGPLRWAFTAAGGLYVMLSVVLPFLALLVGSFMTYISSRNLSWSMLTLENYRWLGNRLVYTAAANSLTLSVVVPTVVVALALVVAFVITRSKLPGRQLLDFLGTLPIAVPGIVFAVGLLWVYFRIPLPIYGTIAILIIAYISRYLPDGLRQINGALVQVSPELEECSRVCGAGTFTTLRRITLPLVRPSVLYAWLLVFMTITREVSAAIVLYTPNSQTLPILTWNLFQGGESNHAYALSMMQVLLMAIVLVIVKRVFRIDLVRQSSS